MKITFKSVWAHSIHGNYQVDQTAEIADEIADELIKLGHAIEAVAEPSPALAVEPAPVAQAAPVAQVAPDPAPSVAEVAPAPVTSPAAS